MRRRLVILALALVALALSMALPGQATGSRFPGWRPTDEPAAAPPMEEGVIYNPAMPTPTRTPTPAELEAAEVKFLGNIPDALTFFLVLMIGLTNWEHLMCKCGD